MFKTLTKSAGAAALLLLSSLTVQAQDANQVSLITGPFGTGSYTLGNAVEKIVAAHNDTVQVVSSETPGLVYNAKYLDQNPELKTNTMFAFTTGIDYLATTGTGPFDKELPPVKLIGNYLLGGVWLATFNEEIQEPADLAGKTIALGAAPQILWTIEPELIIKHGWGMSDEINIERLGTKDAAQALLDGRVDAAIIGGYANALTGEFRPSPQTVELLASGRELHHIPWGHDAVQATIDAGVVMNHLEVSAGSIEGQDEDLNVFFDAIAWVAHDSMDEELAYQVTKTIIDQVGKFADYHALGALMSTDSLAAGWTAENIHPGALRAYREAGVVK